MPFGGSTKRPNARIVFDETRDDLGWIVEEIFKHDDLNFVTGGHIIGEWSSTEYCDLRYSWVIDGSVIDLKARW
jgi:hypothetical protein